MMHLTRIAQFKDKGIQNVHVKDKNLFNKMNGYGEEKLSYPK
jgi:hypothetical protein